MYHEPRMCRTCLQMSRGDFKFVNLDSVDPLWESNSPNLKEQLIYLVPEMKIDSNGAYICTSCFIALRTAYEFKKMCQATEKKFQNHNYKYRRPYGVGPGSAQFHVTLNENCNYQEINFRCQNLNYLQTDTSIDITEHHLYDAAKAIPRKQLNYLNNVTQKLPEIDVEVIVGEKEKNNAEKVQKGEDEAKNSSSKEEEKEGITESANNKQSNEAPKKLDSVELRKRYWLQIHEEEHTSEKPFSCSHCNMKFIRSESLEEHLKIHSKLSVLTPSQDTKPQEHKMVESSNLNTDEEESKSKSKVLSTVKTENDDSKKIMNTVSQQEISAAVKTVTSKLESETSTESKAENPVFDKSDAKKEENVKEAQKSDLSSGTDTCTKIEAEDTTSYSEKNIRRMKKHHLQMVKYCKCLICSKIFRGEIQLYQHCKFKHIPNVTSSNYWLNVINAIREQQKLSKSFEKEETKEIKHVTRNVGYYNVLTPYKCNICDKGFEEENFLNIHMYVHTPTILSPDNVFTANYESPDVYTCYLCNKGFAKERYLKLHNLHVHLTKTTICKICKREFKSDFWFSRHRCQLQEEIPESEDENKTYQCNFCNRKFARLRFMKSHRKRMHKNFIRSAIKVKQKYLPTQNSKEPLEMDNLELDVDPMKLYKISGASSFDDDDEDEENVIEIISDSDSYSDETSNDSQADEDEYYDEVQNKNDSQRAVIDNRTKILEAFNTKIVTRQESNGTEAITLGTTGEITIRRKSVVRSAPKLQCDFCGEYIEESAYDNHIYEHNNMRLQKTSGTRKSDHNYSFDPNEENDVDNDKDALKCHICFKVFKRKFNLITHINRHLSGEDGEQNCSTELGENAHLENELIENRLKKNATPQKEEEPVEDVFIQVSKINGVDIYECCDKTFKLKAHLFRHYKIRHPRGPAQPKIHNKSETKRETEAENVPENQTGNVVENPVEKDVSTVKDNDDENNEETGTNKNRYNTRKSISSQGNITSNEVENIEENLTPSVTIKRKSPNQPSNEEMPNKRQKIIKRELPDADEIVTPKRIKTDVEDVATSLDLNDVEFFPVGGKQPIGRYECNVCDKKFKQKCQLRDHYNVHTGDKPYKCEFCIPARGFTQTSSLYVHFRRVHAVIMKNCLWEVYSKNGSCLVCSSVFEKHAFMFRHMREYYSEKEFQCHVCMKNFNMTCHYILHDIDPKEMELDFPEDNLEVVLTVDNEEEKSQPSTEPKTVHDGSKRSDTPASLQTEEGTCDSDTASSGNDDKTVGAGDNKNINSEHLKCSKCNKVFPDKQQLRFHKKSLAHIQQVQTIKRQLIDKDEEIDSNSVNSTITNTIEDIQNNVNAIMKKIRTIKRHKCPMCEMSFIRKIQLRKHKKKFHRKRNINIKQSNKTSISVLQQEPASISNVEISENSTKINELPMETDISSTELLPEGKIVCDEHVQTSTSNLESSNADCGLKELADSGIDSGNSDSNTKQLTNSSQESLIINSDSKIVSDMDLDSPDSESNPKKLADTSVEQQNTYSDNESHTDLSPSTDNFLKIHEVSTLTEEKNETNTQGRLTVEEIDERVTQIEPNSTTKDVIIDNALEDVMESSNTELLESKCMVNSVKSNLSLPESQELIPTNTSSSCNETLIVESESPIESSPKECLVDSFTCFEEPNSEGSASNSECLEREATKNCHNDFTMLSDENSSLEKLELSLSDEENIDLQSTATVNNQTTDSMYSSESVGTELQISSSDCNIQCSKNISNIDEYHKTTNVDTINNFDDSESLKPVSDLNECVE